MKIKVYYDKEKLETEVELEEKATTKDLLTKLDINPVTVLVSKNNEVILEDENLIDGDDIKIISVISGG